MENEYELSPHQSEEKQEYGDEVRSQDGNGLMQDHLRYDDLTCENSLQDPHDSERYYEDHYYGYDPATMGAEKTTNEHTTVLDNDLEFIVDMDNEG